MRNRLLAAGVVVATLSLGAGCGTSDTPTGTSSEPVVTASSSESGGCTVPDGAGVVTAAVALAPDTPTAREYTTVSDLDAFLAHQGKALPEDVREIRWVDPVTLFNPPTLITKAIGNLDETDALDDELGLAIPDIDQSVTAGMPPESIDLLLGSFDPDHVEQTVSADSYWSEQQELVEAHGQTYYSWGEDGEVQAKGRSAIRDLGIGGRLWVGPDVAAFARATAPMEAFLAGCAGTGATLGDDAAFAGIAGHLDEFEGAFNATLTDQVRTPESIGADIGRGTTAAGAAEVEPLEGVVAYGFASGPSDDEDEARIRLVLASGTDEEAAANEDLFTAVVESGSSSVDGRPWADLLRIDSIEVDGPFLIVELRAESAQLLFNELLKRDSLIVTGS
jgi:hypothetical protein